MLVIAMAQIKGGAGKTTVAVNLAGELSSRGWSVTLFDTDPQQSAVNWAVPQQLKFDVRKQALNGRVAIWTRNMLKAPSDIVIIDMAAGGDPMLENVILISDVVIVPCGASSLDIAAATETVRRVKDVFRIDPMLSLTMIMVPTRVDVAVEEGRQIGEELGRLGVVVGPHMSHDMTYVRSFSSGQTINALSPNSRADLEMRALGDFVLRRVGSITHPARDRFHDTSPHDAR